MLARAGFKRHGRGSMQRWWSDVPAIQAANRRRYFGLKYNAVAITNSLIRKALAAAPPDALRLARRFPPSRRFSIYRATSRSARLLQLADVFPLLAFIIINDRNARIAEARQLVEAGTRLRNIASLLQVPMALRNVQPGAVFEAGIALFNRDNHVENFDKLSHAMPQGTSAQRRWFQALSQANDLGGPYVEWAARNSHRLGTTADAILAQVADIRDWVRASYIVGTPRHVQRALRSGGGPEVGEQHVTRRFSADMSVATVRELSGQWHEAVALSNPDINHSLPVPWRGADTLGEISVVPLDTAAAIVAEGRSMHHCAATLLGKVRRGESYLYSVREGEARVATVEVCRSFGNGSILIAQMRGPCNSILAKPLQTRIKRWASQKDRWPRPPEWPARTSPSFFDDDNEIPF